ncbi:MAG TPA: hypothetical protein DCL44_08555 [Elusimicrobia bacterium]|nr:hypothetical protein [Elusimicrobiota bacterium]
MIVNLATKFARRLLVGGGQNFVFLKDPELKLPALKKIDLYIHIPFCRNRCPYCPYNRIDYDPVLAEAYAAALMKEIELYRNRLGPAEIGSVYVGGGTPTTMIRELPKIFDLLRKRFRLSGQICLETNPADLTSETLSGLKAAGVSMLSVGVQSFNDKFLGLLGRNYSGHEAFSAVERALAAGFDSVNVDMMFVLPGQSSRELAEDLKTALKSAAQQFTLYPLFTFPYAAAGRHLALRKLKMPAFRSRRAMYGEVHRFFLDNGFKRVSVWGFKKGDSGTYSSVTRNSYIGLGAGAGTKLDTSFYLNTFSVREYIKRTGSGILPAALEMRLTENLNKYYWLYWRLYDTYVGKADLERVFGEGDLRLKLMLDLFKMSGFYTETKNGLALTERGSFYIHLAQNHLILNYIDKVWSRCLAEPWPENIPI